MGDSNITELFLFGNVDESGRLASDDGDGAPLLDEEAQRQLSRVLNLGRQLVGSDAKASAEDIAEDFEKKAEDAQDFEGEDEAAEDESKDDVADQQRYVRLALANRRAAEAAVDDDYDAGDSHDGAAHGAFAALLHDSAALDDPRLLRRQQAERQAEMLQRINQAAGGRKFHPVITPGRTTNFTKDDLPQLFPGFGPDRILKFCEMFAPKREIRVPKKDDMHAEEEPGEATQDIGEDEERVFVSYIPPRPVLLRLRAAVETQDREDLDAAAGAGPDAGKASPGAGEAEAGTGLGGEAVPDVLVSALATMPVAQVDWEKDVDWGDASDHEGRDATSRDDTLTWWKKEVKHDDDSDDEDLVREPVGPKPADQAGDGAAADGEQQDGQAQQGQADKTKRTLKHSIMPYQNGLLLYGPWDQCIVWDDAIPPPATMPDVVVIDMNDPKLIFESGEGPPDPPPYQIKFLEENTDERRARRRAAAEKGEKKSKPLTKAEQWKRTILNFQLQINDKKEDIYNLSNDKVSTASRLQETVTKDFISHSIPAHRLMEPFFITHLSKRYLRHWHRPLLTRVPANPEGYELTSLTKYVKKKAKEREKERMRSGGGDIFFMRNRRDLSGRDGEIILFEYAEEFPPLLSNVGMASKIINYFKKHDTKTRPKFKHGSNPITLNKTDNTHHLFVGNMAQGQFVQSIENKLYRAPIYKHRPNPRDFLIVRVKSKFFIREITSIYAVGQTLPKVEVMPPNSRKANHFTFQRLEVYIMRMFRNQKDKEKKIRLEDIKAAFPTYSEANIKKKLKTLADFRGGRSGDPGWWVLKPSVRIPAEEDLRGLVTPEDVCAYESSLAAYQRLRDAGYRTSKMGLTDPKEEEEETEAGTTPANIEERLAPWNATRNFVDAMAGKCHLAVTGVGDPTGVGAGFSCVRAPSKPAMMRNERDPIPRKKVTDEPDADLRKLTLAEAKALLREKFGVPEEDIPKPRWDVINMVRELSSRSARAEEGGGEFGKFARSTRVSFGEHQQKYLKLCQNAFDKQTAQLSNQQDLDSDDDSETSDAEREFAKDLELEMGVMDDGAGPPTKQPAKVKAPAKDAPKGGKVKVLRIHRTYIGDDGRQIKATELVSDPRVIQMYVEMKQTGGRAGKTMLGDDLKKRKKAPGEKRRARADDGGSPRPRGRPPKPKKESTKSCSVCHQIGHVRTNRKCPMYGYGEVSAKGKEFDLTESEEELEDYEGEDDEDEEDLEEEEVTTAPIKMEGTRLSISASAMHKAKLQRESRDAGSLVVRVGKDKRRLSGGDSGDDSDEEFSEYTARKPLNKKRRGTPLMEINNHLQKAWELMWKHPSAGWFQRPVEKSVPDYYKIVERPMDLTTIKSKIASLTDYKTHAAFLQDVRQIVDNSILYNGPNHVVTQAAEAMVQEAEDYLGEHEDELATYEAQVNPELLAGRAPPQGKMATLPSLDWTSQHQ